MTARDDEQRLIRDAATQFFSDEGGPKRLRALRDGVAGERADLWRELAELGWVGALVPESFGGSGLGLSEVCLVLEAAGRALAPEPLVGSAVLAPSVLLLADEHGEAMRQAWLPRIVSGEVRATVAWEERWMRGDVSLTRCQAEPRGGDFVLTGDKRDVVVGADADLLLVSARNSETGVVEIFAVGRDREGVTIEPQRRIDSLPVARITLGEVTISASERLSGDALLQSALDRATIAASAELLGVASAALEMTLGYLRDRRQFDVPIGSFQTLRHRAARMYIALELARSAVLAAARTLDALAGGAPVHAVTLGQAIALAKARANDAALYIADESIQMHGGIGMTDEHDVGLYFKRARVLATMYGDSAAQRDRWARLAGY